MRSTLRGQTAFWGRGAQAMCFNEAMDRQHDMHFKCLTPTTMYFLSLPSRKHLAKYIMDLPKENRCIEEILKNRCEFYADFDSKTRSMKTIPDFIKQFETEFARQLKLIFYEEYDPTRVRWLNCCRRGKFSLHFSYRGNRTWNGAAEMKPFFTRFFEQFPELDDTYTKNRCMRAIHCYNPKKGKFFLEPMHELPTEEYLIQCDATDPRDDYVMQEDCETTTKFRRLIDCLSNGLID